jgi:hypothetical protein
MFMLLPVGKIVGDVSDGNVVVGGLSIGGSSGVVLLGQMDGGVSVSDVVVLGNMVRVVDLLVGRPVGLSQPRVRKMVVVEEKVVRVTE